MSSSKEKYSKKILKKLSEKPAIPVNEVIKDPLAFGNPPSQGEIKNKYAFSRALKNLVEGGYAEIHKSERKNYAKITAHGKTKLNTLVLENEDALVPQTWDGFWRIILLDLPENRKNERESLRYLLKKAGFVCLKNSAWISPFPFEHLFTNIKRDLGLTTEMMIIVTEFIDEESKKVLFETFGK
jgi:DNA-binding transcriptional regulator PaaX